jgi:hypothetical protein
MLAKQYLTLKFDIVAEPVAPLARKYGCGNYSVLILSPNGEVAAKFTQHPTPAQIADAIVGIPEMAAGQESLAQLKEKGITKANAESVAVALKKIGTTTSSKAEETIVPYAKDDSAPEAVQRGAILALAKQPNAAKELVPYLTDKRFAIQSAASTTLIAMGLPGLPAVLDGLASEEVGVRAACFGPAMTITKNGKVAKDLTFWKTGKSDAREKALETWKEWAADQLKPKSKDLPAAKK